jgi:hypothetical protein
MARFERALEALPYTVLLPLLEPREIGALARCSRAALAFGGAEAHWRWLVTRDFCSTVLQAPTSPVGTWRAVYAALDSLQRLRWRAFENAGGKKLRSWRTDRREVSLLPAGARRGQREARVIASGGKFFFQVFSARVADIVLERRQPPGEEGGAASPSAGAAGAAGAGAAAAAAAAGEDKGTRHPFAISKPQLRKMKLFGTPPCPRRAHTMTCVQLPGPCGKDGFAAEHVLVCFGGEDDALSPASEADSAMNDVHVLHGMRFGGSRGAADQGEGAWVRPPVSGEPPVPRCNHCALSLGRGKIAIVGGSRGRTSLQACEVSVLEVRRTAGGGGRGGGGGAGAVAACGEHSQPGITVRWARMHHRVPLPPARQNFSTARRTRDGAIVVFGGMQWGVSTALVSSYAIRIVDGRGGRGGRSGGGESGGESGGGGDSLGEYHTETEQCAPVGDFPGERVGHGMCAIGAQLVLFGGDCTRGGVSTAEDDGNAVFTFDARRSRWTRREVVGPGPGQRRGADCQRWGFSIFTAGGFKVPSHAPIADSDSRELVIGEAAALLGSSPPCPPRDE